MTRGVVRVVVALGAVTAAALGYAAGRGNRCGCGPACADGCGGLAAPPRFEPLDPTAPIWATTGRWVLPSVGSIFRNRLSTAESPLEGFEAVLVSQRTDECLDDCPVALRVVGGPKGAALLGKVVSSLVPNLRTLARADGLTPAAARWIETGTAYLEARKVAGPADAPEGNPLRAIFIGMPRPDVGPRAHSVGLALGDVPDPHFDAIRGPAGDREGGLLFVSRVEEPTDDAGERIWGAVAFVHSSGRASWRPIPDTSPDLALTFGSLWGHYGALPSEVEGVYLDASGRLHLFGSDLVLRAVSNPGELRAALLALLRRA